MRSALWPDVPSFGFATFLSVNAASVWGGVFPYLPDAVRTSFSTIAFYAVQGAFFWAAFLVIMAVVWVRPGFARGPHVLMSGISLSCGLLMLVAAMYVESLAFPLIVVAAALVGVGLALFMAAWQRVFAAMEASRGNLAIIKGTAMSALLYFGICCIPQALTAYLEPLVMVPLAGLCLFISAKEGETAQSMFDDAPLEHIEVYRNALRENALPALSVGALGFCSGAVRLIAVTHQNLLDSINIFSMFMLFAAVVAFYALWRRRTLRLELMAVYRVLFPIAATCLVVLPFAGQEFTVGCSGIAYACFMLACVLVRMHCGQISRDSGINPLIIYSFYGAVVYFLQMCGYLVGFASGSAAGLGVEQLSFVGLIALYILLAAALFGGRSRALHTDRLELLMLAPRNESPEKITAEIKARKAARQSAGSPADASAPAGKGEADDPGSVIKDRLSKQCFRTSELYGLSSREREVMELFARGFTGKAIAQRLFVSENTVRTHIKRIYAKLGIHRKQELLDLLVQLW